MKTLALALALLLAFAVPATATPLTLSDFSSGMTPHGAWTWSSNSKTLSLNASNKDTDYIWQSFAAAKVLTGATQVTLTGRFFPGLNDGKVLVELFNALTPIAHADFTWRQFEGGVKSVSSSLAWVSSITTATSWRLVGAGNSTLVRGSFAPQTLATTVPTPVPEPGNRILAAWAAGMALLRLLLATATDPLRSRGRLARLAVEARG